MTAKPSKGSKTVAMTASKAIIFDLDGCLVDSEPLCLSAIAEEMRALGIADATTDEIGDRFLGVAMPQIAQYVSERLGVPAPPEFQNHVERRLFSIYPSRLRPIENAAKVLSSLHDLGLGLAIATGGSLARMNLTLEVAKLAHWFEGTMCSAQEVARGKPEPDLFMLALERLGKQPKDCMVVEDSPHGITGARRAGIPALGFVGGSHLNGKRQSHADLLRRAGAVEVFDQLEDIRAFVAIHA